MNSTYVLIILALLTVAGCSAPGDKPISESHNSSKDGTDFDEAHISRNSLDWPGRYSGVFPCRDCEGVEITISLGSDGSFSQVVERIGKSAPAANKSGQFDWHHDGRSIALEMASGDMQFYQVGENVLFAVDREGNRIGDADATAYSLEKHVNDPSIQDHKWLLVELRGQAIDIRENAQTPFLVLSSSGWQVKGNASCNGFFGSYALKSGNRITFSRNMGATAMQCPNMSIESAFMSVLALADNYAVADGVLSLNRARMAPLARFRQ